MVEALLSFFVQPTRTHEMEYEGDKRKDKPIPGLDGYDCPIIRLTDFKKRSGVLKLVTVCSTATIDGKYYLHPNLLCNGRKKVNNCDELGVATFKFNNQNGGIEFKLENLCIRHAKQKTYDEVKQKWIQANNLFDPYEKRFLPNAKDIEFKSVRLCAQVIFDTNEKLNPIVSDIILDGKGDIKIENWDIDKKVRVDAENELLYVLVRKVSSEQRDIYARFYDDSGWIEDVQHSINHHDFTFVFPIPKYHAKNIAHEVICNVQLYVKDKEYFSSEIKQFRYTPVSFKRTREEAFEDDEDFVITHIKDELKRHCFGLNNTFFDVQKEVKDEPVNSEAIPNEASVYLDGINEILEFLDDENAGTEPVNETNNDWLNQYMIYNQNEDDAVLLSTTPTPLHKKSNSVDSGYGSKTVSIDETDQNYQ